MARELSEILEELARTRAANEEIIEAAGLGKPKFDIVDTITPANSPNSTMQITYSPDFKEYKVTPLTREEKKAPNPIRQVLNDAITNSVKNPVETVGYYADALRKGEVRPLNWFTSDDLSRAKEDREREEWLQKNQFDMNLGQAVEKTYHDNMTKAENAVYQKYYDTFGREEAEKFYNAIKKPLMERASENNKKYWEEQGKKDPVGTSVASVIMNTAKPIEYLYQLAQKATTGKVQENDLMGNQATNMVRYGREGAGERIRRDAQAIEPVIDPILADSLRAQGYSEGAIQQRLKGVAQTQKNVAGDVANFLYGTGMSMADFLVSMGMGKLVGGADAALSAKVAQRITELATLTPMGMGAAQDTMLEAKERGLNDDQAVTLGVVAGLAEMLTEKFSVEALLKPSKSLLKGDKLGYIIKNFLTEGAEEVGSDIINIVADKVVAGDKSQMRQRMTDIMKTEKLSEEEAYARAFAEQLIPDFLGGAISGGIMGGAGAMINSRQNTRMVDAFDLRNPEALTEQINKAMEGGRLSQSIAQNVQNKIENGQAITDDDIAGLVQASQMEDEPTLGERIGNMVTGMRNRISNPRTTSISDRISELMPSLDKSTATTMAMLYDEDTSKNVPLVEYVNEANDVYLAGARGEDIASVPGGALNDIQRQAMYDKGQEDFADEGIRLRQGSEWNVGENTERPIQDMEPSTEGFESGQTGTAEERINQYTYGEEVKASDLVEDGTDKTVRLVEADTPELQKIASESEGKNIHFYSGVLETKDKDVRGVVRGDDIFIQVDDPDYTPTQIWEHENFHTKVKNGEIDLDEVRKKIEGKDYDELQRAYESLYTGIEMSDDEWLEEIIADSVADMNQFKDISTELEEKYQPHLKSIKKAAEESTKKANAPPVNSDKDSHSVVASSYSELKEENKKLKADLKRQYQRAEKWKNETKITDPLKVRSGDVNKIVSEIRKEWTSKIPVNDLRELITAFGESYLNGSSTGISEEAYARTMKRMAVDIMAMVINESEEVIAKYDEYDEIHRMLMNGVMVSDTVKGDIPDFKQYRFNNIHDIRIVNEGTPLKQVWADLNEQYPYLFPDSIDNETDQLLHMVNVAKDTKPYKGNMYKEKYGAEMSAIVEHAANELIDKTTNGQLRATLPTFADKELEKRNKIKSEAKQRLAELKEKHKRDIANQKTRFDEKERLRRERSKAKELRSKIEKHAKELSNKLLSPTDKRHITESAEYRAGKNVEPLKNAVARVLSLINQESTYDTTPTYNAKTGKYESKHVPSGEGIATKKTEAFRKLREEYKRIADNGSYQTNEDIDGMIQNIEKFANTPLGSLDSSQLQIIYDTLKSLEVTLDTADKMLSSELSMGTTAYNIRKENENKKAKTLTQSSFVNKLLVNMMTPQAFFERMGDTAYKVLFKGLRNSQNENFKNIKTFGKWAKQNIGDDTVKQLREGTHVVSLGNKKVEMTIPQLMNLYVLSKRGQAEDHIINGGIKLDSAPKNGIWGKLFKQDTNVIRNISTEDVQAAINLLTPEEKALANIMQRYASKELRDMGNKASLKAFGYEKFNEENYWRIHTLETELAKENAVTDMKPTSVASMGSAKATVDKPTSVLYVKDIFTDFMDMFIDMNNYATYLNIQEDMKRLFNYRFYENEQKAESFQELLDRYYGHGLGTSYWTKLMSDVANGVQTSEMLSSKGLGKFKATAVGANLRVVVQQPTAILRAMDMIDGKYLALASNPASAIKGSKEAQEYSPLAWWKAQGYFDINTGRSLEDLIYGSPSKLNSVSEAMMKPAGLADDFAWGILWNAVKAEINDTTDLQKGSKEYFEAVKERFEDIVDRTQVVDGVLQRAGILRENSTYWKMVTAFMGEPIKQYNQLVNTIYNARNGKATASAVARTAFAMIAAGTLNGVVKSLVDAMRHSKREKDYWEQFVEELTGISGDEKSIADSVLNVAFGSNLSDIWDVPNYIPLVRDFESLLKGYTVQRTDISVYSDMLKAADAFRKALFEGKGKNSLGVATIQFAGELSKLFGVPVNNVIRDVRAVTDTIVNHMEMNAFTYEYYKTMYNVAQNKSMFKKLMYDTYKSGDENTYKYIVDDLRNQGFTDNDFRQAIQDALKAEEGVEHVEDLSKRTDIELFPTESEKQKAEKAGISIKEYAAKQVKGSEETNETSETKKTAKEEKKEQFDSRGYANDKLYKSASESQKSYVDEQYKTMQGTGGQAQGLKDQVAKAKEFGKSEDDWFLYLLARKMVDQQGNNNGSYDNNEKAKAAQMTGFTLEQVKYISSTKTKPKNK